jgi:Tat protein translocase TatB subunit
LVERYLEKVVFLILESLGSTELLFILVMALVFFGPRKLPQLSRSLGKTLAEFRRASEDFKRTWDREANLEGLEGPGDTVNSILGNENLNRPLQPPTIEPVAADRVIAREGVQSEVAHSSDQSDLSDKAERTAPQRKRDWL